ncbi:MAG: hypothetical protein MZV63_39175 [Marinilabiliales bacterium]|nr:hypothetical protein [Marinilabiliales bacterium]
MESAQAGTCRQVVSMKENMHRAALRCGYDPQAPAIPHNPRLGWKIMNVALLLNGEKTGFLQKLEPAEDEIFHEDRRK